MINMINISPVLSIFLQNVLKTGEMLIRLPFSCVNLLGGGVPISPQMINMINMINISPVLATFSKKAD